MSEWQEIRLGDVLDKIVGGGTPSKENSSYWDGGDIFWCSVKDMSDDKFKISETEDTITLDGLNNSSANLIPKGTVITATRMGLGRAFINETDMAINQDLKALIPNSNIDNKYLLWVIILYRNYIEMLGNGATVKGIRLETLKNIKINLPPLPTQQKIAKILSNYDDLIENNLKRIKLLEESARLTYEEWFLRFRVDGKKLDIDPESGLPFGWKKKSITKCDVFKQDKRKLKEFEGEKIYYATADVDGIEITTDGETINWDNKPSRAQIKPNNNTVWFARMSNTYKVLCFNNKNINLQDNSVLSSGFAGFNAKNDSCLPFLYFSINSKFFHDLKDLYATGATQVSLNNDSMSYIKIIEPKLELIEKFGSKMLPPIEEISILRSKNQLLKEARDILLPCLMTGMIDTDDMDIAP